MGFRINARLFDGDGCPDDAACEAYCDALMDRFAESSEGKACFERAGHLGWAHMLMDHSVRYVGVSPADLGEDDLDELLFDIFPRKVSCDATDAPGIVAELDAFFGYLAREYGLLRAAACRRMLTADCAADLERELADPRNYGMAKSFVMLGRERGYDVTSEEGLQEWMNAYNAAALLGDVGLELPSPAGGRGKAAPRWESGFEQQEYGPRETRRGRARAAEKRKRRMRKASRRRNR